MASIPEVLAFEWMARVDAFELATITEEAQVASLRDSLQDGGGDEVHSTKDARPAKRRRVAAACASCGQEFTEKRSLYRHQRSSRSCKPSDLAQEHHQCSSCDKVFTRADILSRHEKEHHNFLGRRKTTDVAQHGVNPPSSEISGNLAGDQEMPLWNGNEPNSRPEHDGVDEIDLEPPLFSESSNSNDLLEACRNVLIASHKHAECGEDHANDQVDLVTTDSSTTYITSEDDTRSVRSTTTMTSLMHMFTLPFRSSSSLERLGASRGFSALKNIPPCPACKKPFESNTAKLIEHVQSHVRDWKREHVCLECDIGFQCQKDLEFHMTSAAQGSCGFIASNHACTGHHSPNDTVDESELTSHDRLTLCTFLRHWEQAQLEALIVGIDELSLRVNSDRWSFSLLRRRPSSICSSTIITPSLRSEPKQFNANVRKGPRIRTIEQKLARISNVGLSSLIRKRAAENDALLRTKMLNESLAQAIIDDDLDRVLLLLDSGADINAHLQWDSPLVAVLSYRKVSRQPRIFHVDVEPGFTTPAAFARLNARPQIAEALESLGAVDTLFSKPGPHIPSFLDVEIVFDPPGLAAHLISGHASVAMDWSHGLRLPPATARDLRAFITTPKAFTAPLSRLVQWLIHFNHSLGLQAVLELGANPNEVLPNDFFPLEYALHKRSRECVLVLVNHGSKTDATTLRELLPQFVEIIVELAAQRFWRPAQHLLNQMIKSLPDTEQASALTFLLVQAIEKYGVSFLSVMLRTNQSCIDEWPSENSLDGSSFNKHLVFGPPISFAAWHGYSDAVKTFASHGANVDKAGGYYDTPLRTAVFNNQIDIVQLLLDVGANPNHPPAANQTTLCLATVSGSVEMASTLVRGGVRRTGDALVHAVRYGHLALAKYLLEVNVDINYYDAKLDTPLCTALLRQHQSSDYLTMVEFLLNNGADPAIAGPHGNAMQIAMSLRHEHEVGAREQHATNKFFLKINVVIHLLREVMGLPTASVCKWRALLARLEWGLESESESEPESCTVN